jgi:hypothetical protein
LRLRLAANLPFYQVGSDYRTVIRRTPICHLAKFEPYNGRVADVCGAPCEATQVARTEAEVAAGGRACSLTTVQCCATESES